MAKQIDNNTTPDLGLRTSAEFFLIPEMASDYQTPPLIDDTFVELAHCVNAVWARFVREALHEINEVFACRKDVPLSDKIPVDGGGEGTSWRAGHDFSHQLSGNDFPGGNQPQGLYPLSIDGFPALGSGEFVSHVTPSLSVLNFGIVSSPEHETPTLPIVGLVNSGVRQYWLDTTGKADAEDIFFSMTLRIPSWNQANDGVVLASVRRFDSADETGATDRLGWEFGLGTWIDGAVHDTGSVPSGTEQDRVLYLRWYDGTQVIQVNAKSNTFGHQFSIQPGPEWTLGFQRWANPADSDNIRVRFYVNGLRVAEVFSGKPASAVGTSGNIRLVLGSRESSIKFAGGPIRNVYWWDTDTVDEPLVTELYEKTAGFLEPADPGG